MSSMPSFAPGQALPVVSIDAYAEHKGGIVAYMFDESEDDGGLAYLNKT